MDFMNIRLFKRDQKTGIKRLGIFALILVMLLLTLGSGLAEETKEGRGTVDQFKDDKLVVNDCLFKLAPGVKFYTNSKMTTYANRSRFRKGTYVGYLINESRQVTTLWLEKK